jgi:beta-lactamase superfamily II metal-dependent hydrolase
MFTIEMLPADEGDTFWIEYGPDGGQVHRVLIDCGRKTAYRAVAERLSDEVAFELFVLTHVDADHIEGAVPLLQDGRFKPDSVRDVWFNEYRHLLGEQVVVEEEDQLGAQQGEYFAAVLRQRGFAWNRAFDGWPVVVPDEGPLPELELAGGMKITLLSPTMEQLAAMRDRWERDLVAAKPDKRIEPGDWERALEVLAEESRLAPDVLGHEEVEWPPDVAQLGDSEFTSDTAEPNGSSIAFLAEYAGKRALFAGDAHAPVLAAGIRRMLADSGADRLTLDVFKLSHHGSKYNLSKDLLDLVSCRRYLISTNGARHHHPDPEAIARVICFGGESPELLFNYREDEQARWDDDELRDEHGYTTVYPDGDDGHVKIEV